MGYLPRVARNPQEFQHIANFFTPHYCDESQRAVCTDDLVFVTEPTVVPRINLDLRVFPAPLT